MVPVVAGWIIKVVFYNEKICFYKVYDIIISESTTQIGS